MAVNYEVRYATNPKDFKNYDTSRIRNDFLVKDLMIAGHMKMVYSH